MSLIKDYLHTKRLMNPTEMLTQREQLMWDIDGMDWKTMEQFVYDTLDAEFNNYTVEELVTELKDYYPELLEQNNVSNS